MPLRWLQGNAHGTADRLALGACRGRESYTRPMLPRRGRTLICWPMATCSRQPCRLLTCCCCCCAAPGAVDPFRGTHTHTNTGAFQRPRKCNYACGSTHALTMRAAKLVRRKEVLDNRTGGWLAGWMSGQRSCERHSRAFSERELSAI